MSAPNQVRLPTYEELMREFHDKYQQYRRPTGSPGKVPIAVIVLRLRLMMEEFGEMAEALAKLDDEELADALGDFAYVVIGTLVCYDLRLIDSGIRFQNGESMTLTMASMLGKLACAMHEEDIHEVELIGSALIAAVGECCVRHEFPFDPIFREIHRSNMTKTPMSQVPVGSKYGIDDAKKQWKGPDYQPPQLKQFLPKLTKS